MLNHRIADLAETQEGRRGDWMQTSLGGRFYPLDPRPEEIFVSDLANGLALDCRYAGQGDINHYYSVAEHSYWLAWYAYHILGEPMLAWACLFHDAAEAYLNDLPRAVKRAVGHGYADLEGVIQTMIFEKYHLLGFMASHYRLVKELDERIIPVEKAKIIRYPQRWKHDTLPPLSGFKLQCWEPAQAKARWLQMYYFLATCLNIPAEKTEL